MWITEVIGKSRRGLVLRGSRGVIEVASYWKSLLLTEVMLRLIHLDRRIAAAWGSIGIHCELLGVNVLGCMDERSNNPRIVNLMINNSIIQDRNRLNDFNSCRKEKKRRNYSSLPDYNSPRQVIMQASPERHSGKYKWMQTVFIGENEIKEIPVLKPLTLVLFCFKVSKGNCWNWMD